ncbi:ribosome biogenesis GTPase Der [Holospora curviuscula]|uniref:GTPase Der n=1 Tax=Holospora curviuscula TaxID=1082868 RepID=A0A2S5R9G6_9PROT|nr:ribosome biogenesis GTPase Der [Holospora curviuscula]PPE03775.1 GTPase Der [Holospora curviuscula]
MSRGSERNRRERNAKERSTINSEQNLRCIGIVGKPNVGKSTLFNRIAGKRLAIVEDYEGVTRDWQAYEGTLFGFKFTILDTPGLGLKDNPYESSIKITLESLFSHCQGIIFLVDGRHGISAVDAQIMKWLRKQPCPILLVANKCERFEDEVQALDFSQWGLGAPISISALHGQGLWELKEAIAKLPLPKDRAFTEKFLLPEDGIRVAVMGRPNAGKSTFINTCLGNERLLTGPNAGVTRDAIEVSIIMDGTSFIFVDTAGARKQARAQNLLEKLSRASGQRALIFSHITLLCIDGTRGLEKQDLTLLASIIKEGRAVVVGLTKWDQVKDKNSYLKGLRRCLDESIASGNWIPLFPFSSVKGQGIVALCKGLKELYVRWNHRIATGPLNRWMAQCIQDIPPPLSNGIIIKPKYITQIKTRPPRFIVFGNQIEVLPAHYQRYFLNRLVETFNLEGVNPRIEYKNAVNPYEV